MTRCMPILQGPALQSYNRCHGLALLQAGVQTQTRCWINCLCPVSTFASQSDVSRERGRSSPGNSGRELGMVSLESSRDATDSSCFAVEMQAQRQKGSMTHIRFPWFCSTSKIVFLRPSWYKTFLMSFFFKIDGIFVQYVICRTCFQCLIFGSCHSQSFPGLCLHTLSIKSEWHDLNLQENAHS